MAKFRKKPVVIEAIQYHGAENVLEVLAFTGKADNFHDYFVSDEVFRAYVAADPEQRFKVYTLEGTMIAKPGDWIIRGVSGEHYPCKPDIFAATYEVAE